jgi:5-hydroxyisourate hydrolase-like protein (transthyretin family)
VPAKDSIATMKPIKSLFVSCATVSLLVAGAAALTASVTGTVTDKTTGRPAAGDAVVLVEVQAGMSEVAHATTDAQGHYSLNEPASGPYLIRVTHQGAGYFIAAPESNAPGNIAVYDVAAKVKDVSIEADVYEIESNNGQFHVTERYFVHNTSSPPRTEWSRHTFAIVLPPEATIEGAAAQRPTGLPANITLDANGPKGHYAFNFPIQPDEGDKDTLFEIEYTVPYSNSFTFHPQVSLPAQAVGVLLPKSMSFAAGSNSGFQSVQGDANVQTFLARSLLPGKFLAFTVSGIGSMPHEKKSDDNQAASTPEGQPGGGIGEPINTPDPLSKFKWWLLSGLALALTALAAFLLRKPAGAPSAAVAVPAVAVGVESTPNGTPTGTKNAALLSALKEELFELESEKLSGTVTPEEYAERKSALETALKGRLNTPARREK